MKYYKVSYTSWEIYSPVFLIGPEMSNDDFKSLCNGLLEKASFNAIENNEGTYVGWQEIVDELASLLVAKGFIKPEITELAFFGTTIIMNEQFNDSNTELLGSAADAIFSHNADIRNSITLE